jgi:aspartate/methionine/tyrosine aminotransferase
MAGRENILLINDAAYQSIPSRQAVSLLSVRGGKRVGVEVCSFSYLLGLPWLPFGFAAGNREIINGLAQAASLLPVSPPRYLVQWARRAMRSYPSDSLRELRRDLTTAADAANDLLALLECEREDGTGTPFVWARLDERENATVRARTLFQRFRILVAPGTEFGEAGEGYLRFSLLGGGRPFEAAVQRLKKKSRLLKRTKSQ